MDKELLWEKTCALVKPEMSSVSYQTWIEQGLKPVDIRDEVLYAQASSDFVYSFVEKHWGELLGDALSRAAQQPMKLKLLTRKQAQDRAEQENVPQNRSARPSSLIPGYTFDSFVVGNSNSFAHAACLAVAEAPADAYNPLFLYGGVGLGKTHLMHAIGHYILEKNPDMQVRYVTTEAFTNELITAIQQKKTAEFREKYRQCDLLLVDDVQFLARRESTQEEFFHTFNALHAAGKQIVLSSDKPPREIQKLEERLSSRFEWGLIADIQKPDYETRVAILQRKAADELMDVAPGVLEMIASRVDSNIRELEGCLKRLSAYAMLTGRPIDQSLAEDALREIFQRAQPRQLTCQDVMDTVARYYSITAEDLKSPRRSRQISVPRQIAMYLCREVANVSFPRIGDAFQRDHSTIQHGCDKIAEDMKTSASLTSLISDLTRQLRES